jgi:16S rRNA (cytosine967-C5)-methyltransferase
MVKYFSDPRRLALEINLAIAKGPTLPEEALRSAEKLLNDRDRRLAHGLVHESLRHRLRLERIIKSMAPGGKPPKKALEILKIGLTQLMFMDRVPSFAAVNETVRLAKAVVPYLSGFVNAVMARLAREREAKREDPERLFPAEPCPQDLTALGRLSTFYSYPPWLVERAVADLGFREARALLVASNLHPRPTIRVNPLKTSREAFQAGFPTPLTPTPFSPHGLVPGGPSLGPVESWPGFAEGLFAIQDEASQILPLLAGEPKTILDGCAGLGGKTLALASAFPEAAIVSVDNSAKRLAHIPPEAMRLGLKNPPRVIEGDLRALDPGRPSRYDLAVVDAPCTGLGVIRRHPDIKWNSQPGDPAQKSALQLELLLAASRFVAPGGRLIYSVCTFTDEEGPSVVSRFLAQSPDFAPLGPVNFPQRLKDLFTGPGLMRLWPHKHFTDGFFYGLLQRRSP